MNNIITSESMVPERIAHAPYIVTILAKFGHKPDLETFIGDPDVYDRVMEAGGIVRTTAEGAWLLDHLARIECGLEMIQEYTRKRLTSYREIEASNGNKDLVEDVNPQRFNSDFDCKRKIVRNDVISTDGSDPSTSPFTVAFESIDEMKLYRRQMEVIRKQGRVARPTEILHRVEMKGRIPSARGGSLRSVARLFLTGVLQKHIEVTRPLGSYAEIAATLTHAMASTGRAPSKPWSRTDVKNASRGKWLPGAVLRTGPLTDLVDALSAAFEVDPKHLHRLIFIDEAHERVKVALVEQVVRAILYGPGLGIEPFSRLFNEGRLPDVEGLRRGLAPHLTPKVLDACRIGTFIPGARMPGDQARLSRLFLMAGLIRKDADVAARLVAPPVGSTKRNIRVRHNSAGAKILRHFVSAVLQPDIVSVPIDPIELLCKLNENGLTRRELKVLWHVKFQPGCIKNSPANRALIRQMAKPLGLNPVPIADALLGG